MDDEFDDLELEAEESISKVRRPGFPVEPRRLVRVLTDNRVLLLRTFAGASVAALVLFFFVPRTYQSSAQLLYEGTPALDVNEPRRDAGAFIDSAKTATQLRQVRERLGWDVSLRELEDQLTVSTEGNSMLLVATASGAKDAQALAQTALDVFLAQQASFNAEKLKRLTSETRLSLEHAHVRQAEANEAFEAFREKSGKPNVLQDREQLLARVSDLRTKADEAAVEVAALKARIKELERAQRDLPRQVVATATKGSPVDAPLANARAELASARASLSEEHPRVQALQERVNSLQAQRKGQPTEVGDQTLIANPARDAVEQDLATARAGLAAAQEREAALRVLMTAVQAEADALAPVEGEARQVMTELELADQRVEELTERAADLQDAALGPMTGFRVLSPPALPEEAERSKKPALLLAAVPVLAVLVVFIGLVVQRLRSLTVEAPREVAWWGNGPVLGTSVWPRDSSALETFVDELEDHGVRAAGRTLVVPATEAERDVACAFAIRLSEAPWLAAAILDVEQRAERSYPPPAPLVTPPPSAAPPQRPKRLSSQGIPSVSQGHVEHLAERRPPVHPTIQGFAPPTAESGPKEGSSAVEPAKPETKKPSSSRPPQKKTIVGLPAAQSSSTSASSRPPPAAASAPGPDLPSRPPVVRGVARAAVRMVVQSSTIGASSDTSSSLESLGSEEEAFLLTRPVTVTGASAHPEVRSVDVHEGAADAPASHAVMRAAIRLLGQDDDTTELRRSDPPPPLATGEVTGVALTWNGPLSGPVLRRAARLAHRVMVVVSSGMSVVELSGVKTRLGRQDGVGYVLVNLTDDYVDLEDRVGPVEAFWEGPREGES